jgi:TPR repeat protein
MVATIKDQSEQNNPRAMAIMSIWNRMGFVHRNLSVAKELAERSAALNDPFGYYSLAKIIEKDDVNKAIELYDKALSGLLHCTKNSPYPSMLLAEYFYDGLGTCAINIETGNKWMTDAWSANDMWTLFNAALILVEVHDNVRAQESFVISAKAGFPASQYALYKFGPTFNIPREKQEYWLRKAAEQGYAPAESALARMTWDSSDPVKIKKSLELYERAVEQDDIEALMFLAERYAEGTSVEKNREKSKEYFKRVASSLVAFPYSSDEVSSEARTAKYKLSGLDAEVKAQEEKEGQENAIKNKETDFLNELVSKYGKGKDDCYQVVIPQLIGHVSGKKLKDLYSINDKVINHKLLYGKIQRFWNDKNNLFMDFAYNNSNYDINDDSMNSLKTSFNMSIQKAGKIRKDNNSSIAEIGYSKVPSEVLNYDPNRKKEEDPYETIVLSEKQVEVLRRIYPTFKKWAEKFRSAGESTQTMKVLERPFVFIWTGSNAKIGIISETSVGDRVEQLYSESFVEDIMYCVSQIPELQNMLFTGQKNMVNSQISAKSRVEELTR